MHCRDCGLLCAGEQESLCTFCRTRNRFWEILDDLLRGWAINSLRIWTSILQEEGDKRQEHLRLQEEAGKTTAPQQLLLVRGERNQQE